MPNVLSIPVPNGSSAVAWASRNPGVSTLLFVNSDLVNTVYVGSQSNITPTSPNVVPILPNGTFSGDAQENWYVTGAAAGISPLVVVPNGQAYFLGITAGLGKLAIPQVQSPNFVTGVSGWIIRKDGSAEFNNVVIRGGAVIGGTTLDYSGPPAFGNLVYSQSSAAGTDSFGNAYLQGSVTYNFAVALQQFYNEMRLWFAVSPAGPYELTGASVVFGISSTEPEISFGGALLSSGGSLTNPTMITTDAGAIASTFGTDWGASGSGANGAVFQLQSNGWVNVAIDVKTTAAAPAAEICAIPFGYAPTTSIVCGALLPTAGGGSAYPLTAFSSGTLQQAGVPAVNGVRYAGIITYPGPGLSLP